MNMYDRHLFEKIAFAGYNNCNKIISKNYIIEIELNKYLYKNIY
jgi:hypothetical protein